MTATGLKIIASGHSILVYAFSLVGSLTWR